MKLVIKTETEMKLFIEKIKCLRKYLIWSCKTGHLVHETDHWSCETGHDKKLNFLKTGHKTNWSGWS
jgi:hypothetical protein